MIRVNELSRVNFISRPAFKSEEAPVEKSIPENKEPVSLDGIQALASYNLNLIDKAEKLDEIQPLDLIYKPEEEIEGERIYDSEGKLNSIVKEDANTKTVYIPDKTDENLILKVKIIDKKSGIVLKVQENDIKDGKYTGRSWIGEYSSKDGKLIHTTNCQDGKDEYSSLSKSSKDGEVTVSKYNQERQYRIDYDSDK